MPREATYVEKASHIYYSFWKRVEQLVVTMMEFKTDSKDIRSYIVKGMVYNSCASLRMRSFLKIFLMFSYF